MKAAKVALFILCAVAAGWLALVALLLILADDVSGSAGEWLLIVGLPLVLLALGVWGYQRIEVTKGRPCPRCAADVPKGTVVCPTCGFDFGTLVPSQPSQPSQESHPSQGA